MRLGYIPADRCHWAIRFGVNLATRCMYKRGHNGPHHGKGLKQYPYQRIDWYQNDSREFTTDKDHEFAWSDRRRSDG